MRALFHLVDPEAWRSAAALGEYRADSLYTEGFIHCSFLDQVEQSANTWFRLALSVCAVELNPEHIAAPVHVEDTYASGTEFPHVYGPIPTAAAVAIHDLVRNDSNLWIFRPH